MLERIVETFWVEFYASQISLYWQKLPSVCFLLKYDVQKACVDWLN